MNLSKKEYILSPLKVTVQPIGIPSLILKPAMAFLALVTRAKKAIAGFKIREGMPIGCTVTLRGDRMYSFLERFINIALPRIRDFRGVNPKSFDGRGNYTVGVKEQLIFPEISFDKIDSIRGMDITIVTSAKSDQEGKALLQELGMPFSKN